MANSKSVEFVACLSVCYMAVRLLIQKCTI